MFITNFNSNAPPQKERRREGELYKVIEIDGERFEVRYGFYEELDRQNPHLEPIEIYPDFVKDPVFTKEGIPFVTAMQKPCENFKGDYDEENTCYQCAYYERCEELLGICRCEKNKKMIVHKTN